MTREKDDASVGPMNALGRKSVDAKSMDVSPQAGAAMRLRGWSFNQKVEMMPKELDAESEGFESAQQDVPRARKSSLARLWNEERTRPSMPRGAV